VQPAPCRGVGSVWGSRLTQAIRTATPERDLGLVDFVTSVVDRREARSRPDGAVDIDYTAADSADQMVMVVADAIFKASRRSGGLDAADQPTTDQHGQRVIDGLKRDGTNLRPDGFGHGVGCNVGLIRDGTQDSQSLGRHLNTAVAKKVGRSPVHRTRIDHILESFQ
jgi:hypothetical protein